MCAQPHYFSILPLSLALSFPSLLTCLDVNPLHLTKSTMYPPQVLFFLTS